MKKIIILLAFFPVLIAAPKLRAQCFDGFCGGYYGSASYGYGSYNFFKYASTTDKVVFGIDSGIGALNEALNTYYQHKAFNDHIKAQSAQIESIKSLQRMQREGTPFPMAHTSPDGRPHSPQISWDDVQAIE